MFQKEKNITIADRRREANRIGHQREVTQQHADFQRQARHDKESYLNDMCAEIETTHQLGKSRDLWQENSYDNCEN